MEQGFSSDLFLAKDREDDQEFSRYEWELLARYAEKGCEQHGFSSDSELPIRESFAQALEASNWRYRHCGVAPTRSSTDFTVAI